MKRKRIIALILLVLVAGVSFGFVKVMLPVWRGSASALAIEEQKDPVTTESGVEGHRDFPFRNRTNKPLTIRLERTDCECARVQICVTPDEWKGLEHGGTAFVIPPGSDGSIRVTWKAIKVGASSIGIELRVDDGEKERAQTLTARVNFVAPAVFCSADDPSATEIDVGRLKPGQEWIAHFLCFSTTRDNFALTPAPNNDPCIAFGSPQPLTFDEIRALSEKAGTAQVRGGYHVKVTVREQAGDHRLDIGPFHRRIVYKTDVYSDHQVSTYINGTVAGEVSLAASDGNDWVNLGTIVPDDPKPTTFTLQSRDPQIQLTVDEERTLPHLKVELLDGKEGKPTDQGKQWRVRVVFRKDALFRGAFPDPNRAGYDSADLSSVVFFVSRPGQSTGRERRLFVPVRGHVRLY